MVYITLHDGEAEKDYTHWFLALIDATTNSTH